MKLITSNKNDSKYKYYFDFDFNYETLIFCRALKGKYQYSEFGFDNKFKQWGFNNVLVAKDIREKYQGITIDNEIVRKVIIENEIADKRDKAEKKAIDIKRNTKSDISIDGLKLDLYDFQKVTVEFIDNANGRCMIGSEVGTGKTPTSLAYCVYKKLKKILIVSPASVKSSWEKEAKKWTNYSTYIINSDAEIDTDEIQNKNVIIINYDILEKFHKEIIQTNFDIIIFDESHMLKNHKAKRTKVSANISSRIDKILLMSGTLVPNRPIELFSPLSILDKNKWGNYYKFAVRYCAGKRTPYGFMAQGATNIEELKNKIAPFYIRFLKDDVLKKLPERIILNKTVSVSEKEMQDYNMIENDFKRYLKEIKGLSTHETIKSLFAEKLVKLNELRQATTNMKINASIELADKLIKEGHKVVIFSVYNLPLEKLLEHYGESACVIYGKTSAKKRGDIVNQFQNNPDKKVFLGGMISAGAGITLTSADSMILIDKPFVPAHMTQAQGRIHRPSQNADKVCIYKMTAPDTIDSMMQDLLDRKERIIDSILDNKEVEKVNQKSIVNDLLKRFN